MHDETITTAADTPLEHECDCLTSEACEETETMSQTEHNWADGKTGHDFTDMIGDTAFCKRCGYRPQFAAHECPGVNVNEASEATLDPATLDPNIRAVVLFLRDRGFDTCDSGDGVSKLSAGPDDCVRPCPHVTIRTEPGLLIATCDQVRRALEQDAGVAVVPLGPDEPGPGEAVIEGVYLVGSGVAIVDITHLDDADLALAAHVRSSRDNA